MENHTAVMKTGILEIVSSSSCTSRALSRVLNVSAVLEKELVLNNLGDFVNAFIVLFNYCMHSSWSKTRTVKDNLPQNETYVIHYLLSCRSKPVRPIVHLQKKN